MLLIFLFTLLLQGCNSTPSLPSPLPTRTPPSPVTATLIPSPTSTLESPSTQAITTSMQTPTQEATPSAQKVRFGVIGDYGSGSEAEGNVADLIISWEPEFIITTGDNNYPNGELETIDEHIGQFFHEYISPYQGSHGEGSQVNRFFPTLGNHDWNAPGAEPYLGYFALPGNERYYDFVRGPVHFFALDSDSREPDGVGRSSMQAAWLQAGLSESVSPWKIVYFHHAPYSSGTHGPVDWMQWPFAEWGADLILSGHDHTYERILKDGITYIVNGLGGKSKYEFLEVVEGSQVRYNEDYGAMLVEADQDILHLEFINRQDEVIDTFQITKQ